MPLFSRLFGKSSAAAPSKAEPVLHKDCRIYPEPLRQSGGFNVAARIEKEIDGETRVHQLIRADTYTDATAAAEASVDKAKQAIDQLGDEIFR